MNASEEGQIPTWLSLFGIQRKLADGLITESFTAH